MYACLYCDFLFGEPGSPKTRHEPRVLHGSLVLRALRCTSWKTSSETLNSRISTRRGCLNDTRPANWKAMAMASS